MPPAIVYFPPIQLWNLKICVSSTTYLSKSIIAILAILESESKKYILGSIIGQDCANRIYYYCIQYQYIYNSTVSLCCLKRYVINESEKFSHKAYFISISLSRLVYEIIFPRSYFSDCYYNIIIT